MVGSPEVTQNTNHLCSLVFKVLAKIFRVVVNPVVVKIICLLAIINYEL